MKKLFIAFIALLLSTTIGYSQNPNYAREKGKVTQYEMSMTEYEADKDAEAVVVYDLGNYYFFPDDSQGFMLTMTFKTKIKILKQAGIEYADFEIPFYVGGSVEEEVRDIEGVTYNYENGELKKSSLEKSKIYEEKYQNTHKVKKFTMPDVREGSVIEVSYTIYTPYNHHMREWQYQKKIPVVYSNLVYKAIPYYEYSFILKGHKKFDIFENHVDNSDHVFGRLKYKELIYNMGMENLPAFKDQEFITSSKDYMTSLNFQLSKINYPQGGSKAIMTTWKQLSNDFLKYPEFGKYIKDTEKEAKKILPTLALDGKTSIEKVEIISNYVKNMYNWNGSLGKYAQTKKVSDFMKEKTGNAANINLFLIGLLKAANVQTEPVLLSTRGNGIINTSYPFENFFNYVVAQVKTDEKTYYIDATESLLHYDELPSRCVNVSGVVIRPDSEEWIFINQEEVATTNKKLQIKLYPEEGRQEIQAEFTAYGNDAFNYRKSYISNKNDMSQFLKKRYNIDTQGDIEIKDFENRDKPFSFSFAFSQPLESTPEKLFVKPFCGLSLEENIFKQTTRDLPVDLIFILGDSYETEIEIPEGYKVESVPRNSDVSTKTLSISYATEQVGNKIRIKAKYETKKNIYPAQEYGQLKSAFGAMIGRYTEMIVFVKE